MSETCKMSWMFHPNFDDSFDRHMGNIRRSDLWWGKWWCHIHHSALAAHDGMLTFIFLDSTITISEQREQLCGYKLGGVDHINQSPGYLSWLWSPWLFLRSQVVFLSQAIRYKTSSRALIWPWREKKTQNSHYCHYSPMTLGLTDTHARHKQTHQNKELSRKKESSWQNWHPHLGQNNRVDILSSKQPPPTTSPGCFPGDELLSGELIYSPWASSLWSVIWGVFLDLWHAVDEGRLLLVCVRWQNSWWPSPTRVESTCLTRQKSTLGGSEWCL